MTLHSLRGEVRRIGAEAGALVCPHCRRLVRLTQGTEDAALSNSALGVLLSQLREALQDSQQEAARRRELRIEDADELLSLATPEEAGAFRPLLDAIRNRIVRN
jgi:hypothetical protein